MVGMPRFPPLPPDFRLRTPRAVLRPLEEGDADALHAVLGDAVAMTAYEGPFTPAETREWVRRQRERYLRDGAGLWALISRETGEVLGDAGITRQRIEDDEVWEVGYHLVRSAWGRGLAAEAAAEAVDWAFGHDGVESVHAKVRDTNLRSMNVAIRVGMTVRRRFEVVYRGVRMPHLDFAVSRAEWSAAQAQHGRTRIDRTDIDPAITGESSEEQGASPQ